MFKLEGDEFDETKSNYKDIDDNSDVDYTSTAKKNEPRPNRHIVSGIDDLLGSIEKIINQSALSYKKNKILQENMNSKIHISKSIVTQTDLESVVKLINNDINNYMAESIKLLKVLKGKLDNVHNKANSILNKHTDKTYIAAYDKHFLLKNLDIRIDKHIHDSMDTGMFLISLKDIRKKNDIFILNLQKTLIKDVYSELRYLDNVYYIGDNIFACTIIDVDAKNFDFIVKRIIKKVSIKNKENLPIVPATMINKSDTPDGLVKRLKGHFNTAKTSVNHYHFSSH